MIVGASVTSVMCSANEVLRDGIDIPDTESSRKLAAGQCNDVVVAIPADCLAKQLYHQVRGHRRHNKEHNNQQHNTRDRNR